MTRIKALVCFLPFALVRQALAQPPGDFPLETLIAGSDLIVVGSVASKDGPKGCHLRLPHTEDEVEFQCSDYQVTVATVLLDRRNAMRGDSVSIVARDSPPAPDRQVPQLRPDVAYLFLLKSLPGDASRFYLPDYYKHYRPSTEQRVQAVERALSLR